MSSDKTYRTFTHRRSKYPIYFIPASPKIFDNQFESTAAVSYSDNHGVLNTLLKEELIF